MKFLTKKKKKNQSQYNYVWKRKDNCRFSQIWSDWHEVASQEYIQTKWHRLSSQEVNREQVSSAIQTSAED